MNFKSIFEKAIDRNCDVDVDGNIDGITFAVEQIIQDMDVFGYKIVTKTGKAVGSGLVKHEAKKRKPSR